jgi:alpha-ketoglutarate-dependent taurine dioxygenase
VTTERMMIHGPTVWSGSSLGEQDWLVPLKEEWLDGLAAVNVRLRTAKITIADATPTDFRAPELAGLVERVKFTLENGPGLVVLRGWRIAEWGEQATSLLCWGLGSLLGAPRPQNARGDRIHLVTDTTIGTAEKNKSLRGGMSNKELALHTDKAHPPGPPRVLGLLCLRRAAQGGQSLIVSGHSVHNRLLEQHPELLEQLYQDFHFGRGAQTYADGALTDIGPVFKWHAGRLSVRYNRHWIERGHEAAGKPLPTNARAALDAFDEILTDAEMALRFFLLPGDLLLLDNRVVLHGRTAFIDHEDPRARRCLMRLWLD